MPIFVFLKANVQRLWFYQKLYRLNFHRSLMESPVYRRQGREQLENRRQAFVQPPAVVMLPCVRGPLEAPLDNRCGLRIASSTVSLGGGGYLSTFGGVAGILAKF